ncbi:MAG: hypothetical protein H0X33_05235 [Taibaiella sp.]|nr:hypothetical protein [Taibaiella sp.]
MHKKMTKTPSHNHKADTTFHKKMKGMDMGNQDTMAKPMTMDNKMDMEAGKPMDMGMSMKMGSMNNAYSLNLPMTRDGSGTSWVPDATPMYGIMVHSGKWMFMFHGDIFPRYNKQDLTNKGSRGNKLFDAPDMLMAMGQRKVGKSGLFHFNVMLSTDAFITGGNGYPLLFQTGESWQGKPLVDRQHPHDLFSELSISYAYSFSKKADLFVYVGYPGEPALGPVTFMHRPSGMFIPDAPISHHWADATHITFGVATVGVRYGKFKLEGSSFTGREPDENRYNFDKPRFDSWSTRLSYNPDSHWALQVSHGLVKSPEALNPNEDINRTTASATYVHPWNANNYISATALWGQNQISGQNTSNALLLEATLKLKRLALYTRYEWVQKSVEELHLDPTIFGDTHFQFSINALTVGAGYDLFNIGMIRVAGGGQMSLYHSDEKLDQLYGTNPLAAEIYLHLYPQLMHNH